MMIEFSFYSSLYIFLFLVLSVKVIVLFFKYGKKRNYRIRSVFSNRPYFLLTGFIFSLIFVTVVLNISVAESKYKLNIDTVYDDIIDIDIPVTSVEKKKLMPKPPPPVIETVPDEDILDDEPDFLSSDIDIDDPVEDNEFDVDEKPLPPPPPEIKKNDIPLNIVEIMPRFPGCEELSTDVERDQCARNKFLNYIYSNLTYPAIARETGIEGRVVVRFIVEKNGSISGIEVLRDIGGGCGEAAAKVIKSMNNMPEKWVPGRQGGRKVKVYYTLPVIFKLKG